MTAPTPRLRGADVLPLGTLGLRARRLRTALSALGIAIGIAAIVGVLGITQSSRANLLHQIDRLGTNLLTVANGQTVGGQVAELPAAAPAMIARMPDVQQVTRTAQLADVSLYRSARVPAYNTQGLAVRATDAQLLATLSGTMNAGWFLNRANAHAEVTVLGYDAAHALGIGTAQLPARVWISGYYYDVVGILDPLPLAPEIDRSALIGFPAAARDFGFDGHPSLIYLRTDTARVTDVAALLGATANPEDPEQVTVSRPSDTLTARAAVASTTTALFLGLGAVALLVGGIGVANVMVIGVLERRNEIGLRRSLGAAGRHITAQFLTESLLLSALGGVTGVLAGLGLTAVTAHARHWRLAVPPLQSLGAFGVALVIGAIAGLYPALRAARLNPADALRTP
jgi:putative ABC transport system permease protein